jgi:hypothetical protein
LVPVIEKLALTSGDNADNGNVNVKDIVSFENIDSKLKFVSNINLVDYNDNVMNRDLSHKSDFLRVGRPQFDSSDNVMS